MTFLLSVFKSGGYKTHTEDRTQWWEKFTRTTREEKFGPGLNFPVDDWIRHRTEKLAEYHAFYDGIFLHFESEQDSTLFLLRWS
jgi:hypothetical protein